MIFSLITNDILLIKNSHNCGIDRIMIDLEFLGKKDRQNGMDLFQSNHKIEDIKKIKKENTFIKTLVRINQINQNSKDEINKVIDYGADIIMLPYFKNISEIETFIKLIDNRVELSLLIETSEAINLLEDIIKYEDVSEYHIGLNDLSISLKNKNIFQTVLDGTIEKSINILKKTKKKYGFGGVGSLNKKDLMISSELFLFEQLRNECNIGWLGRSFRDIIKNENDLFNEINFLKKKIDYYNSLSVGEKNIYKDTLDFQIKNKENILNNNFKKYRI